MNTKYLLQPLLLSEFHQVIFPQYTVIGLVSGLQAFQKTSSSPAPTKEVMAVPNTRQRAKELVQQIAKNHGYLGEEKLRLIEPELRREIEEAFLKKDQMIGSSVIT